MIPILGSLVMLAIFVLAVGSALVTRFGTINPEPAEAAPAGEELSDNDSV